MKEIKLTRNAVALVDDDDFERINQFKWHCSNTNYAQRSYGGRKNKKCQLMTHFILGTDSSVCVIDHINGNTLDNRKENLRVCSHMQNSRNMRRRNNKSGYKGVTLMPGRNRPFYVRIRVNKQQINLGSYTDIIEAARVYDAAALKYFGEFAKVNFRKKEE